MVNETVIIVGIKLHPPGATGNYEIALHIGLHHLGHTIA
jgi:hypothetical protein